MSTNTTNSTQAPFFIKHLPATQKSPYYFIWAHGWMRTHKDFLPIAQQLTDLGEHYLLDLPGHGESPLHTNPNDASTAAYMTPILKWVSQLDKPVIWVGHSFGCRIGAHAAKALPGQIKALKLFCPPLNQKKRFSIKSLRVYAFKALVSMGLSRETILPYFASKDYLACKEMQAVFSNWVNEDSSKIFAQASSAVDLIFAENDTATPPTLAKAFKQARPDAAITIWRHFDHSSILTDGQHQIIHHLLESFSLMQSS